VGLEKYKVTSTAFERYYDIFLQNAFRGRRYKIVLASGDSSIGIPTSGSLVNPLDPNVSFAFKAEDGSVYRIPFADLKEASVEEPLICSVRTIDPHTAGGGDFSVLIQESDANRLFQAEAAESVFAGLRNEGDFVDGAPQETYKFLTVSGTDFKILEISRTSRTGLKLVVERL
jgi:hypothetical protein